VSKEKSAMKVHPNYLIASFLFVIFGSCEKDDQNPVQLIGKWKLVEQLVDPGDGSGVFESLPVTKRFLFLRMTHSLPAGLCAPWTLAVIHRAQVPIH
jgi:hypothetical protein